MDCQLYRQRYHAILRLTLTYLGKYQRYNLRHIHYRLIKRESLDFTALLAIKIEWKHQCINLLNKSN